MNLETMAADVGPAILIRCALSSFVSSHAARATTPRFKRAKSRLLCYLLAAKNRVTVGDTGCGTETKPKNN